MCNGAARVDPGNFRRLLDPATRLRTVEAPALQASDGNRKARAGAAMQGLVRENTHEGIASGELLDPLADHLGCGVDDVRSHDVAHVDSQVDTHDVELLEPAHPQASVASTPGAHRRKEGRKLGGDFLLVLGDEGLAIRRDPFEEDLGNHLRLRRPGTKSAAGRDQGTREGCGGDDRGLLHGHRDVEALAVDEEPGSDADGDRKEAHRRLDHGVRPLEPAVRRLGGLRRFTYDPSKGFDPLVDGELAKIARERRGAGVLG